MNLAGKLLAFGGLVEIIFVYFLSRKEGVGIKFAVLLIRLEANCLI